MQKLAFTFLFLLACFNPAFAQKLTQMVRGTVLDSDSKLPLIGVQIVILDTEPRLGTVSDAQGNFRLEKVPIGRISLQCAYVGYDDQILSNLVLNSGKELILNVNLQESISRLNEVVVSANSNKGEALNDMAILSARSISPEQTNRYAGGFNDPSRIMSNFAGVTNTQDGSNDVIIRGNSPKYVQWRLEGVEITNPNHFGDQSAVGGSVSTLNNNLLATSDFYTGAFSPEYGDVLSGVYDVKLRAGNNEQFESVFSLGLLGTEFTLEGPFKKGYGGSFLVNYRYSTISMISDLGLVDIAGSLKFQDAAFKVVLPTKKAGVFSIFAMGGNSSFLLEDVTPALWETPGNGSLKSEINEDFNKGAFLLNTGINHTYSINSKSHIRTTLAYSSEGIDDDIFEKRVIKIYDDNGQFLRDSAISRTLNFNSRLQKNTGRGAVTYNYKINPKNKLQIGTKYSVFGYQFKQSNWDSEANERFSLVDFNENIGTLRNFVSVRSRINENLTLVSGLHNMNVLYNKKSTLEPRVAMHWQLNPRSAVNAGYGSHSTMESVHNYFAKVELPDGSIVEPNKDLGLLKAHHFVLGYEQRFGKHLSAKIEAYYQHLYNLPVENNDTSYYATINEGLEFRYVDLVNKGTGKNYGIELTVERFFHHNFYFLFNTSLYQSKYKSLEGVERNTQYNSNYLVNFLCGKEFTQLGRKKNKTLGLNAKVFFTGGKKIIPLLRDTEGNLAVDPENNQFWDYEKAFDDKIEDVYQVVLSASYKWQKPRATHELFLNLDNVTNHKGKISEFYDESAPGGIGYLTQFGFFPNVMYRVYF